MTAQTKKYSLAFTVNSEYLYVNLTGNIISSDIIRDYISEIVMKCSETGLSRILLYRDIPAVLPESATFYTVNESLTALRGKKLALVNPHEAIDAEVSFGVTVGQNRGGNYRSFNTVAAAEAWLIAGAK